MRRTDQYELANAGDDDVMTKNVTSDDESMIQRLSERHVAVVIATTSLLTLIMLIVVVVIVVRHRRCQSSLIFFVFPVYLSISTMTSSSNMTEMAYRLLLTFLLFVYWESGFLLFTFTWRKEWGMYVIIVGMTKLDGNFQLLF